MKLNNYIYFIKKRNHSNINMHIISYIISIICFGLLCFILSFPWIFNRAYRDLDRLLPTGIDKCVIIDFKSTISDNNIVSKSEEGKKFIFDLLQSDEIYGIGEYTQFEARRNFVFEDVSYAEMMYDISSSHRSTLKNQNNNTEFEIIGIKYYFKDFYEFNLYKGDYDILGNLEDGDVAVYLGYNYKDVPIGACFYDGNSELKEKRKFYVAGILEKGSEILDVQSASTNFRFSASYAHNLDNMMVQIVGKISKDDKITTFNTLPVSFSADTDYEAGVKKIKEIANENGITVNIVSMRTKIDNQLSAYDDVLSAVSVVSPIAFLVSLIILLTVQLLISVVRSNETGIWLSNGMTRHEIFVLLFLDNLKKMIASSVVGSVISGMFLYRMLYLSEDASIRLFLEVYIFGPVCVMLIAILSAFVISIISYAFIGRKSLPDIIRNCEKNIKKRKIYRSSGIFSGLFVASFMVSFILMYYGLYLYQEYRNIDKGKNTYKYDTNFDIILTSFTNSTIQSDLGITKGNLYEKIKIPIASKEYGDKWGYLVTVQHEPMLETINDGKHIGIVMESEIPLCVIGDRWKENVFVKDDESYISIYDTDVKVLGILDGTSLEGRDKRFFIFLNSLNQEIMNKWFGAGYENGVFNGFLTYVCSSIDSDIDLLEKRLSEIYGEQNFIVQKTDGYWEPNESEIKTYTSLMRVLIGTLSILCVFNMVFLSVVWSKSLSYEFMVKRIFGYKIRMLIPEIVKTMVMYEIPALVIAMMITIGYEFLFSNVSKWFSNIANGYWIAVIVFFATAFGLSIKPLLWISKANPIDYVSGREE